MNVFYWTCNSVLEITRMQYNLMIEARIIEAIAEGEIKVEKMSATISGVQPASVESYRSKIEELEQQLKKANNELEFWKEQHAEFGHQAITIRGKPNNE